MRPSVWAREALVPGPVAVQYKAAGILPLHRSSDQQAWLLLGRDRRRPQQSSEGCWSDFGGKVEARDDRRPWRTAVREFGEETEGAGLTEAPRASDVVAVVWNGSGKHLLFVTDFPPLPVPSSLAGTTGEKTGFAWARASDVFALALAPPGHPQAAPIDGFVAPGGPRSCSVTLFRFFATTMRILLESEFGDLHQGMRGGGRA